MVFLMIYLLNIMGKEQVLVSYLLKLLHGPLGAVVSLELEISIQNNKLRDGKG
jgi:hypothetical protein